MFFAPIVAMASFAVVQGPARLTPAQLFIVAEQARAAGHVQTAETLYDALANDPNPEIRAEARFRKGMMLADAKRYREAALAFRALLDEKPNAARVRLELARILALLGDEAAARREVRQAQAAGLPPEVALIVDQFANAIRSPKRLGGSIEVAFAPDSNINRATDARTLDTVIAPLTLSEDARAQSGLGLQPSGQVYARVPLSERISFLPRVSGRGSLYRRSAFNDVSGSTALGLQWQAGGDRVSPSVSHGWRWYGGNLYARTQSLSIDWLHAVGRKAQIDASFSASRARYTANPRQNGAIYGAEIAYEWAFTPRAGARLSLSAARQTARDPGYATKTGGSSALFWHELGKATLFLSAGARRLEGDARLLLFPERRREWLYHASAGATLRRLTVAGFAPIVRFRVERNDSTVGIYDYQRNAAEIGITRAF